MNDIRDYKRRLKRNEKRMKRSERRSKLNRPVPMPLDKFYTIGFLLVMPMRYLLLTISLILGATALSADE